MNDYVIHEVKMALRGGGGGVEGLPPKNGMKEAGGHLTITNYRKNFDDQY